MRARMKDEKKKVNISHPQLRDLDRAAQGLDNAVHALFKDVVGFGWNRSVDCGTIRQHDQIV